MIYNDDLINMTDSKLSEICVVNADNEFQFMNRTYKISDELTEYAVRNKYDEVYDYTNESLMSKIIVVQSDDDSLIFYDESTNKIKDSLISRVYAVGDSD